MKKHAASCCAGGKTGVSAAAVRGFRSCTSRRAGRAGPPRGLCLASLKHGLFINFAVRVSAVGSGNPPQSQKNSAVCGSRSGRKHHHKKTLPCVSRGKSNVCEHGRAFRGGAAAPSKAGARMRPILQILGKPVILLRRDRQKKSKKSFFAPRTFMASGSSWKSSSMVSSFSTLFFAELSQTLSFIVRSVRAPYFRRTFAVS